MLIHTLSTNILYCRVDNIFIPPTPLISMVFRTMNGTVMTEQDIVWDSLRKSECKA